MPGVAGAPMYTVSLLMSHRHLVQRNVRQASAPYLRMHVLHLVPGVLDGGPREHQALWRYRRRNGRQAAMFPG